MVGDQASAERRIVTTLFADLAGSTELSERLDPEELDTLLSRFFSAMETTITRFGGVVEKYIGDAIVAFFGTHQAFGDDAARAVRSGLAMQRRLAEMRVEEGDPHGALRMRIGVESGEVLVVPGRETERLATGQSLNVAARIQAVAEEGTVLVGERAAQQSLGDIVYGDPRSITAKGVSGTVMVRLAIGERQVNRGDTPFVGRDSEVAWFRERLAAVADGAAGVITVSGPTGSGRSRLIAQARSEVNQDVLWLEASARQTTSAPAYALLVDLVRSWLGLDDGTSGAAEVAVLSAKLASHLQPDLAAEVEPVLSVLLDPGDTRAAALPGDVVGRQLFRAVLALVAGLSAAHPVVIVADGLDAADDDSLRLLAHVATLTRTRRVVIVAVVPTRPSGLLAALLDEWRAVGSLTDGEIALAPLAPDEARRLVSGLLPDAGHDVIAAVVERGSGEPYMLEQFAAAVAETGGRTAPSIPDTVRGAIQARLDTLDASVKERLRAAAVFGSDVTAEVLAMLVGEPSERELATLTGLGLLSSVPGSPGAARFSDPLVQEVAYAAVPKSRRADWHRRAARFLEGHAPDSHAALAFHYAGSGDEARARDSLVRAGDDASAIAADAGALHHYRTALESAGNVGWDAVERSSLERKIGEALVRRGSYDQARSHLERGLEVIGDSYPASASEIRRRSITGLAAILRGATSPAGDAAERELSAERARLYSRMGWVDYFSDGDRFFLDALRAVRFGSRAGDTASFETVQGLMGVGIGLDVNGNGKLAARFHRRALATAEASQDRMAPGLAHLGACVHEHHLTGDWDAALHHARTGMAAFARVGATHEWGTIAYLAAWILASRGGFLEALGVCDEMLTNAYATGDRHLEAWATEAIGRVALLAGSPDRALSILSKAEAPLAAIPDNMNWTRAKAQLIQSQAILGDLDAAAEALASTERFVLVHDVRGFYRTELATARARLAIAAAEASSNTIDLDITASVAAVHKAGTGDWEGRAESLRLACALAVRRGRVAAAFKALDRADDAARHLRSPLHQVVVARDRWRLTADAGAIDGLRAAFNTIGIEFDVTSGDYHPAAELGAAIDTLVADTLTDGGSARSLAGHDHE